MSRLRNGLTAFEVTPHHGMLRGFIMLREQRKTMFWYRTGRMTPARETEWDLIGGSR